MLARSRGIDTGWELEWQPCDNQCLTWSTNLDPSWQHGSRKPAVQCRHCKVVRRSTRHVVSKIQRWGGSFHQRWGLHHRRRHRGQHIHCHASRRPFLATRSVARVHSEPIIARLDAFSRNPWHIAAWRLDTRMCQNIQVKAIWRMKWRRVSSGVGNENMNLAFHFWFDCGLVSWMIHRCIYM